MNTDESRTALCAQLRRRVEQLFYRNALDRMVASCDNFGWWMTDRPLVKPSDVCVHDPKCPVDADEDGWIDRMNAAVEEAKNA